MTVAGFTRTKVIDVPHGDDAPFAEAYFIGPAPKPDPLTAVTVPNIVLTAVEPPPPAPESRAFAVVAVGHRSGGCGATVTFRSDPYQGNFGLTPQQLDDVRKGTQVFIQIVIGGCPT
ncbi:hypothetical protein ACWEOI_31015 [Nocardia sp. NPDC004340]